MTPCIHHHVRLLFWEVDVLLYQADLGTKLRALLRIIWTFLSTTPTRGPIVGHDTYGTLSAARRIRFGFIHPNAKKLVLLDMQADGKRDEDAWEGAYNRLAGTPADHLAVLEVLSRGFGTNLRETFRYVTLRHFADTVAPTIGWADRSLAPRNRLRVDLSREAERVLFSLLRTEAPAQLREFLVGLPKRDNGTEVRVITPVDGWNLLWGWIDYDKLVIHVGVGSANPHLYIESCIPAVGLAPVLAAAQQAVKVAA